MISKALIGVSALISAGLVSAYEPPASPELTAAMAIEARFPTPEERFARPDQLMFSPVSLLRSVPAQLAPAAGAPKRDRVLPAACGRQDWPYIAAECLVSADATPPRRPARVITIERRYGEATSMLAAVVASR